MNEVGLAIFFVNELHAKQRIEFKKFAEGYNTDIPTTFRIDLRGWTKSGKFTCAIWQIYSAQGAGSLSHLEIAV